MLDFETSLAIQWLRLSAPNAVGTGLWKYDPAQRSQKNLMFDFYPWKKDSLSASGTWERERLSS